MWYKADFESAKVTRPISRFKAADVSEKDILIGQLQRELDDVRSLNDSFRNTIDVLRAIVESPQTGYGFKATELPTQSNMRAITRETSGNFIQDDEPVYVAVQEKILNPDGHAGEDFRLV